MKKKNIFVITITLLLITVVSFTYAFAAEYSKFTSKFIKNFKDCESYEETTTSEFEGKNFSSSRKILGWRNGFCKYQETISSSDGKFQVNCAFSPVQVDELYNAMKNRSKDTELFELETFIQEKDANGKIKYRSNGSTTIKGNKAYITWAKYQNNPYFCKPQKL